MRSVLITGLMLVALTADGAPAPLPRAGSDLAKLQGHWVLESECVSPPPRETMRMRISGRRVRIVSQAKEQREEAEAILTIAPGAQLKPIELRYVTRSGDGPTCRGVYGFLDDGQLKIVATPTRGKSPRLTNFQVEDRGVLIFRRAKP